MHQTIITHNKDFAYNQLLVLTLTLSQREFELLISYIFYVPRKALKACLTQRGICLGAAWVDCIKEGERTHYG